MAADIFAAEPRGQSVQPLTQIYKRLLSGSCLFAAGTAAHSIKFTTLAEWLRCVCSRNSSNQRLQPLLRRIVAFVSDDHIACVFDVAIHECLVPGSANAAGVFVREDREGLV